MFISFVPRRRVSAIVLLAESHMTLHNWAERSYAAADVFVCGDSDPAIAAPVVLDASRRSDTVVASGEWYSRFYLPLRASLKVGDGGKAAYRKITRRLREHRSGRSCQSGHRVILTSRSWPH
ncbi:S-adenosylmethionine decarboxylase [Bradyrhizobium sp. LMG 9283]|uniref:S-adenosylmethionine decarboxylase n=1 Tax=Bradyrhizobium sp. LMG 9283 TaxID=592064 RepID=UPI00388E9843